MAKDSKPRVFQDGRDMLLNVIVVVVLMLVGVGATGLCTYNPGRPEQGPVQEVDARTFLSLESRAVGFPVRYPEMPDGWVTNSARRTMINQQPAPVVGWVSPDGGFLQLTQTGASLEDAIAAQDNHDRPDERTENVAGREVRVLHSNDQKVRDIWALDAGDVRMVLTGAGTDDEFRELIAAALAAAPIDPNENQ
ncbi:DUF4245 domain-containing protein [Corynebacterium sp. CNCTC7651]|uniref:DUF4245 domain-containing protein n=1 Tax=Corynebacterium sp. CNCTC7651 TaxID=2815361 RepID=UPI001F1A7AAA|nr:DUF4245 domain-containing protein [Corynebacterium sp. CNCTC7651]UIZ92820.1 DUF4245 domain-containing protein [Corynebacterium sp. CNCTC7651]